MINRLRAEVTVASMTTGGPARGRAIPRYFFFVAPFFFAGGGATAFRLPRFGGSSDRLIASSKIRFTFTFTSRAAFAGCLGIWFL
jgi:hypothetical protein